MKNKQSHHGRKWRVIERAKALAKSQTPCLLEWRDLRDRFGPRSWRPEPMARPRAIRRWWDFLMGRFDQG